MRELRKCGYSIHAVVVDPGFSANAKGWLAEQARRHGLSTLLAHADDGVIWGQLIGEELGLSGEVFEQSPALQAETLQQARLFGEDGELYVWRGQDGAWRARLLTDEIREGGDRLCFDEPQILWGDDKAAQPQQGFTLVEDGQQGLRHAVPLTGIVFGDSGIRPLRLGVRHYLETDQASSGMPRIVHSRLTKVWAEPRKEESHGQVAGASESE